MAMQLSADRRRLLDELERLEREVAALIAPLSPEQLDWQPDGGRAWSVGQCVDHLSRTNALYLPALVEAAGGAAAAREPEAALRPNLLGRWFVGLVEPPARLKFRVPLAGLLPASRSEKAALLAEFRGHQRAVIELVRSTADRDLDRARFRNPLLRGWKLFNVATGLLVIAAHERRHLAQARGVAARPDFPS